MEDDEDFEELFSFAAASPGQPAQEKTSPSSAATSDEFDIITNDNDSSGSGGDNARTTSCSAMMPSTPAAASTATSQSDFDDLFGSPPTTTNRAPSSSSVSAAAATTKEREDDDPAIASFLGSDALDGFDVHDEGTRDFLDWLDDDTTGKKQKNDDQINNNVGSNDKNNDTAGAVDDDDDDFDFDQMLSEVGIEDVKKPTVVVKESTTPMAGSKGSNAQKEVGQVKQIAKTEPVQTKTEPKKEPPAPPETKPTVSTKETAPLSSPAITTIPPVTQKVDEVPPTVESVTKASDDNISSPPVVEAKDDVIESQSTNNNDLEDDAVAAATPKIDNEPNIESNENEIKEEITPETETQGRPSVEDELSYQQWNDDNDDDDDAEVTDVNKIPENSTEGDLSSGKDDAVVANEKKIVFTSLSDAIRSSASTIEDVRSLFKKEYGSEQIRPLSSEDRAYLWTKVICGKVLEDVDNGSLADSFREWQNNNAAVDSDGESLSMLDPLLLSASSIDSDNGVYEATRSKLFSVLNYHSQGKGSSAKADPLLPPVAHAILQTGMPLAVASVVLSQIEPKAMPLMRLSNAERFLAAKALHADFYLLACYHLPLLMMHLDRNCQDWHWPKKVNKEGIAEEALEEKTDGSDNQDTIGDGAETVEENAKTKKENEYGLIPLCWFVTNFAGECDEACMDHADLLPLWDHLLTTGESSWKFFLAIAVLEKRSDVLLMMKGDELRRELEELFHFKEVPVDSFVGSSDNSSGGNMITEWLSLSKSLIECTPSSVIELLRSADDRAVGNAIKLRQIQMEEELRAQADAHEAALKKERDERDAEEKKALTKARLTAYYRTHNPEKVDTIDQILKLFDGRMEVLNEKLKKKYGSGFLPDEAPINQVSNQTKSFFMSVNQSINETKRHVAASVKERRKKSAKDETNLKSHVSVALEVSATEVIPHICSKKQAAGERNTRLPNADGTLNFYLIDCRPESISSLQGRFPKAINMSPEKLQDPEELQRLIDMFEALRGAVHICVMGEGFTSFPVLYNHTLSKDEQQLLEDDVSRTSSCALFFLKKGFPFVSILRGGFAAAHAFLSRSGPPGMSPTDVLIDYDPDVSLFALLEDARQEQENLKSAPAREKATRAVQRIIDNSMTRLTLVEQKINSSAAALSSPENAVKVKQSVAGLTKQMPSVSFGRTPPLFMSKKLVQADEAIGDKQKSFASDEGKKEKTMNNIRLPSFKSDVSSQREFSSEANIDSSSAAPVATSEGEIQGRADPSKDSSNEVRESKLPKIQLDQAKNSLSSFANRLKAADSKGKSADVGEGTVASTKEEAPSKISASFASFATRMKTSAAAGGSADSYNKEKSPTEGKPADEAEATAPSTKEEAPSKISASFSSFATRMKTSAAATGSKAVDKTSSEKDSSSNMSTSFSSFAAKMKTSTTDVTGKAENTDERSISNRLSSFSLKKTATPDWMKKSDQNSPEGTEERAVSERLGWLMRNEPPGKSFSKSKSEQQQDTQSEATGDESLVLDVEEEINFD